MNIGILGGGQLGLMTFQALNDMSDMKNKDITLHFLDENPNAPCSALSNFTEGDVQNADVVFAWGKNFDLVTYEWELVSLEGITKLEALGIKVFPKPKTLGIIRDKGIQKAFYKENEIPTSSFELWEEGDEIKMEFPLVQKARTGGYDGKGVQIVKKKEDLWPTPSVLEKKVKIKQELAIIIARNEKGSVQVSPLVDMIFDPELNLVSEIVCPVEVDKDTKEKAEEIATKLAESFDLVGILAVEFFLTKSGSLLVNEVAPRPHNSGHLSIEGWTASQFLLFIESISGKNLSEMKQEDFSLMLNVIGKGETTKTWGNFVKNLDKPVVRAEKYDEKVTLHDYLKKEDKIGRKMGHITICGKSKAELYAVLASVKQDLAV